MNTKVNNVQITKNKKAFFDYEMVETYEAWIILKWYETKSVRNKHVNLKWSYIINQNGELYVKWMHITPWKTLANRDKMDTMYPRKILLHKKDIIYLSLKLREPWYSIIPVELYFKWSLIKIRVALAKWKKSFVYLSWKKIKSYIIKTLLTKT